MICIICNKDCLLSVSGDLTVTGNLCPEGAVYAMQETQNPARTVTSTVKISGALIKRCPVKSLYPIPKNLVFDAIRLLGEIEIEAPALIGQVVVEDICKTGIPFVTTRSMPKNIEENA